MRVIILSCRARFFLGLPFLFCPSIKVFLRFRVAIFFFLSLWCCSCCCTFCIRMPSFEPARVSDTTPSNIRALGGAVVLSTFQGDHWSGSPPLSLLWISFSISSRSLGLLYLSSGSINTVEGYSVVECRVMEMKSENSWPRQLLLVVIRVTYASSVVIRSRHSGI